MKITGNFELNVTHPDAGTKSTQGPQVDETGHFDLTFFQVVHDILEGAQRGRGMPLGKRWDSESGARAELVNVRKVRPAAYVQKCTSEFHNDVPGNIEEYYSLKATVMPAA